MKQIIIDILRLLSDRPGLSFHRVGIELSGSWSSPYVRTTISELICQGFIQADTSGKKGHSLTVSDTGLQALTDSMSEAPGVTA